MLITTFLCSCSNDDVNTDTNEDTNTDININTSFLENIAVNFPNQPKWVPSEEMKSRDGSSMGYGVVLNPNSKKLLIFLDGGGACFNGISCIANLDSYTEADFTSRISNENALIINRSSGNNQFSDWNFVFIPYATGDVHSGNNPVANVPGGPINQVMTGYNNIGVVLNDLKLFLDTNGGLDEIVFAGSSAGAFGTFLNTHQLAKVFGTSVQTTVIVDAGQIFLNSNLLTPCLDSLWSELWQFPIPSDVNTITQRAYEYDIQKLYEYLSLKYPSFNFGFLSYYKDETNRFFYSFGQGNCTQTIPSLLDEELFKNGLLDLQNDLLIDLPNWKVFYKEGESHTFLGSSTLDQSIDNVRLNDWLLELRNGTANDLIE